MGPRRARPELKTISLWKKREESQEPCGIFAEKGPRKEVREKAREISFPPLSAKSCVVVLELRGLNYYGLD